MSIGSTKRQAELLRFIIAFMAGNEGIAPTLDEMRDAMGLASKSGIVRMLGGLADRGLIRRVRNRARALEVIEPPGSMLIAKRTLDRLMAYSSIDQRPISEVIDDAVRDYVASHPSGVAR